MLNFIGTGSAFNTSLGNNGAFLKCDTTLFMIDCGSATFERLLRSNVLDGIEDIIILMTHTHPDHAGSLGDLIFYSYYSMGEIMKPKLTVYAPSILEVPALLELQGVKEETYHYEVIETIGRTDIYGQGGFSMIASPIPVTHVKELNAFAYTLTYNKETIYYSGDANEIPSEILEQLQGGRFKYFYQDTCKADYPGNVHLSLRQLAEMIDVDARRYVYCMHLDKGFDPEEAKELGFNVASSILE